MKILLQINLIFGLIITTNVYARQMSPIKETQYSNDSTFMIKTFPSRSAFFKRYPPKAIYYKKSAKNKYDVLWEKYFDFELFYSKILFHPDGYTIFITDTFEQCNVHPNYINLVDLKGNIFKQFYLTDLFDYDEFEFLDACGENLKKSFLINKDTLEIKFKNTQKDTNHIFQKIVHINIITGEILNSTSNKLSANFKLISLEKNLFNAELTLKNTSKFQIKLHPELNEFITIGFKLENGYGWFKKYYYPFSGLDFGGRRILPCIKPIELEPSAELKVPIKFNGKQIGISGYNGFSSNGKKFKFNKYKSYKIKFDERYPFELLKDVDSTLYLNGCYFCAPGNWGFNDRYVSKFNEEEFENTYKSYFKNTNYCKYEYDRVWIETPWIEKLNR